MNNQWFDVIRQAVDAQVHAMCAAYGMMSLGELAAKLEAAPQDALIKFETGWFPGCLTSYRGYYDHIAIEPTEEICLVSDLLERVKAAIGATYTGYKGGEYTMTKFTPVWVSPWGDTSGIGVIDISVNLDDKVGTDVIIKTALVEDD